MDAVKAPFDETKAKIQDVDNQDVGNDSNDSLEHEMTAEDYMPSLPESAGPALGEIITMGQFSLCDAKTLEPLEWRVINVASDKCLLLSEYGLDARAFHDELKAVTWAESSLRAWLNGEFLNKVFTPTELEKILESSIETPNNPKTGISGGEATCDRIFILSLDEVESFLPNDYERQVSPSLYARQRGAFCDQGFAPWWLRTPGEEVNSMMFVNDEGGLESDKDNVTDASNTVRVAFWKSF